MRALARFRRSLFRTPLDAALTLAVAALAALALPPLVDWAIVSADWSGASRADCSGEGACWVFVRARLGQFLFGFYPEAERWRVVAALALALAGAPALWFALARRSAAAAGLTALAATALAGMLLVGGIAGLPPVGTERWGGLMLTLVVSYVGVAASLPLGVLLALGRRSRLPALRALAVAFIELWRGVPLITVLFMATVMLPLFFPAGLEIDKLVRALIGVALFASAYMAEVVRGGLQAVPRGQIEAAAALGLGRIATLRHVVLPQALRAVLPGIVNVFIGLLKDTTLVLVIGLFDLLGIVQAALADPNWLGFAAEGYVFAGVVFWVMCFGLSRAGRRIETTLARRGGGAAKP